MKRNRVTRKLCEWMNALVNSATPIVVDPIMIPGLKELQTKHAGNSATSDRAQRLWLARNPDSRRART